MKQLFTLFFTALCVLLPIKQLSAADGLALQKVTDNVYALVGELGNRSPENLGGNATFGVVVTPQGVVLIDPGASWKGAAKIYAMISTVTEKPVKIVINTGGQDHRWLGNGYFSAKGARIIANQRAVEDQKARVQTQLMMLNNLVGAEGMEGTTPVYAGESFDKDLRFEFGGTVFELHHAGQAHTPGDSFVWLPQKRVVFSGDIIYMERMLGVSSDSNSLKWLGAYEALAALHPETVVPGHGHPASLEKAEADTHLYLLFLRNAVRAFMASGGDATGINRIDQSRFKYLLNFDTLAGQNALQVFSQMEWE